MRWTAGHRFAAVAGDNLIARGDLRSVATAVWEQGCDQPLVLEDTTGQTVDLDLNGSLEEVLARLDVDTPAPTRGRPKLGVTAREVTLLPRHWEWLAARPGGTSAALRRLVDQARRENSVEEERRRIQDAVYRVTTTLAGDRPGYEEAMRALFAGDLDYFHRQVTAWPPDIAAYLRDLTAPLAQPS